MQLESENETLLIEKGLLEVWVILQYVYFSHVYIHCIIKEKVKKMSQRLQQEIELANSLQDDNTKCRAKIESQWRAS